MNEKLTRGESTWENVEQFGHVRISVKCERANVAYNSHPLFRCGETEHTSAYILLCVLCERIYKRGQIRERNGDRTCRVTLWSITIAGIVHWQFWVIRRYDEDAGDWSMVVGWDWMNLFDLSRPRATISIKRQVNR